MIQEKMLIPPDICGINVRIRKDPSIMHTTDNMLSNRGFLFLSAFQQCLQNEIYRFTSEEIGNNVRKYVQSYLPVNQLFSNKTQHFVHKNI